MITIDISQSVYKGTGSARFITDLTKTIIDQEDNKDFSFFFSGLRQQLDPNLQKAIIKKRFKLYRSMIPPKLLAFLWNQLHLLPIDYLVKSNIFISSDWTEPPALKIKKATIVHDLAFLRYPNVIHPLILKHQRLRLKWIIKESSIIFTDAKTTVSDINTLIPKHKDLLQLSNNDLSRLESEIKIKVIYPGVSIPIVSKQESTKTINKLKLKPKQFFLTVGKIEPRKNLSRLISAYNQLKTDKILVVVGPSGWDKLSKSEFNPQKIIFTGYISDTELFSLYKQAYAFVFPSLWEGFGYPLIESALSETPIICSDIPIFKELIDKYALFFNPKDSSDIRTKLQLAEEQPNIILKNIKPAFRFSQRYSWINYYNSIKQILSNL
ncbi:MAG: glycosyl transferase family 1 [Patescibacteria group bacterium]|nr:MAG: glycosyl transferase family 1 [Patescibacteria group bacterium]